MSRTDKDRPYWVREYDKYEFRSEFHHCGARREFSHRTELRPHELEAYYTTHPWAREYFYLRPVYNVYYREVYVQCDIHLPFPRTEGEANIRACGYILNGARWYNRSPGWWVHDEVTQPRRTRDRDVLKEAIKWHRTSPEEFAEDFDLGYDEPHEPYYW